LTKVNNRPIGEKSPNLVIMLLSYFLWYLDNRTTTDTKVHVTVSQARVTRLGKFSPNGWLFTLDIFWKWPRWATFLQ
jgi:hypothetical protein